MGAAKEHYDVVVVGAGLSGVNAAYRLGTGTSLNFTVLESRHEIGGTWSLFKYPGIRSDSEMFTLGFPFRPWDGEKSIADGADILKYIQDTAREFGIDKKTQCHQKVSSSAWNSKDALWTLQVKDTQKNQDRQITCRYVIFSAGYYDYDQGYYPDLPGCDSFKGQILKPQFWPEDLDYSGKKIVIIGSGATAVTLLPNMAKHAKQVTMLQRSPSYFIAQPSIDPVAQILRKILPAGWAHTYLRIRNQTRSSFLFYMSRIFPNFIRRLLRFLVSRQLPKNFPMDPHFSPNYKPWDQRLCMVPDGDMFKAIKQGRAAIATGHIDTITPGGIKLKDGQEIEADFIVQATGLKVQMLGGTNITIDGKVLNMKDHFVYKGQMIDGVPNLSMCFVSGSRPRSSSFISDMTKMYLADGVTTTTSPFNLQGYTNASWTLGSDLCARYLVRLLNHMKENGYAVATPTCDHNQMQVKPLVNLNSGYLQRAKDVMPQAAQSKPWRMRENFFIDWINFKTDSVKDEMVFSPRH